VETPILVPSPGMEPHLGHFRTALRDKDGRDLPAYLITSPEYAMKRLLAAGHSRVFEITRCFRNDEPWDGSHNPEFTMIEWYRTGVDYRTIMRDTEEMVSEVAIRTVGRADLAYRGKPIDLTPPWPRLSVAEAFDRHAGIDLLSGIDDPEAFAAAARTEGIEVGPDDGFDDVFFKVFLHDIEPHLGQGRPAILHDYPRSMAALARLKPGEPRLAERFEVYCAGLELANAFSELNDPEEQERRLVQEREERRRAGKDTPPLDRAFLEAVGSMPDAAGIALGVDRLVMLLTDAPSIRDVLFFPAGELFGATSGEGATN